MKNLSLIFLVFMIGLLAISCKKDIRYTEPEIKNKMDESVSILSTSRVFYVSPSGNDKNNGSSLSTPWKTITKVNAQKFIAGDQVLFEGGKTFAGSLEITNSGASGSYIKFASYGVGKALVNAGTGNGIYVYNNSFVWINNLVIYGGWNQGTQSGNDGYGVFFYNTLLNAVKLGNVFISYCDIYGFRNGGIGVMSYPSDKSQTGYADINVSYNTVHNNGLAGIITCGSAAAAGSTAYAFTNVYVGNNKVYDNLGVKSIITKHTGDGILIGDAAGGKVEKNVAYNNGWYNMTPTEGPAAIWCYDSKNIIFQYNEAHHNGTGSGKPDGDGFDLDGGATNCIMQYNYSHDNYAAGFLVWEYGNKRISNSNNIIRYNISQNDNTNSSFYAGITLGPDCNNNLIYNNTIYSNKGSSVWLHGGTGNKFANNIFYVAKSGAPVIITANNSCWFFDNDYYNPYGLKITLGTTTYTSLTAFRVTGNEKLNGINYGYSVNPFLSNPGYGGNINTGDPSVLTNYMLKAASPLINKGFNLTTWGINPGSADFKKATIPYNGAYDIGACEFH